MSPTIAAAAQLLGRVLLSIIFIMAGWGKISAPDATIAYIASHGLPIPQVAYYVDLVIEFGGGLAILLGLQTRFSALVLAGFCVVTGVIFHYHPGDQGQMINYLKNLAMAGGFLQLFAVGGGAWSLDAMIIARR